MDSRLSEHHWAPRDHAAVDRDRPSRLHAEEAVRTLISWAGDDPAREGLIDTPERVARAYEEWFAGYDEEPGKLLERCFEEIAGYDEIVLLRDIRFESHCEHHMAPVIGRAHIRTYGTAVWSAFRSWRDWSRYSPSGFRSRKE
jgi:GTP cyclohydrolase I